MPKPVDNQNVMVAGAGLVGALAALFLAKRGKKVLLLERRSDPRKHGWAGGRSINLAISTRGLSALDKVGLRERALAEAVRMPGRQIHPLTGSEVFQAYGTQSHHCIHSISRGRLNEILLEKLAEQPSVEIRFDTALEGWSANKGWEVRAAGQTSYLLDGVFLFGCDGAGSAVRRSLVDSGVLQSNESLLEYGYKELSIPPGVGKDEAKWQMKKEALHIWPRGHFMLIALPNLDGSYTVTLFLPLHGEESFARLTTDKQILEFFTKYFPDVVGRIPDPVEEFKRNPTGFMGTVRCNTWSSEQPRCLLLGDAAHAIVPFFGQGMNCGFEDCAFLDELLEKKLSFAELSAEISRVRKPNADAIATMALENFIEMRDSVGNPKFLLQKEVEKILERALPGKYQSRYEMVSFSRIPYQIAWEAGEKQKQLLAVLCEPLKRAADLDVAEAKDEIERNLSEFYPYWEDKNGSWH